MKFYLRTAYRRSGAVGVSTEEVATDPRAVGAP